MDTQDLNTELYRRTRQKIDPDDPAFLLVVLNQILLEKEADEIGGRVGVIADGFERITRRSADELIDAINKASSVLQGQATALEAAALKVSVPEFLGQKYPDAEIAAPAVAQAEGGQLLGMWASIGFYAAGLVTGLCIAGLLWVFFK